MYFVVAPARVCLCVCSSVLGSACVRACVRHVMRHSVASRSGYRLMCVCVCVCVRVRVLCVAVRHLHMLFSPKGALRIVAMVHGRVMAFGHVGPSPARRIRRASVCFLTRQSWSVPWGKGLVTRRVRGHDAQNCGAGGIGGAGGHRSTRSEISVVGDLVRQVTCSSLDLRCCSCGHSAAARSGYRLVCVCVCMCV